MADYRTQASLSNLMANGAWDDKYVNLPNETWGNPEQAQSLKPIKLVHGMRDYSNKFQWNAKKKEWEPISTSPESIGQAAKSGAVGGVMGLLNLPSTVASWFPDWGNPGDSVPVPAESKLGPKLSSALSVPPPEWAKKELAFEPATTAEKYTKEGVAGLVSGLPFGGAGALGGLTGGVSGQGMVDVFAPEGKNEDIVRATGNALGGLGLALPYKLARSTSFGGQVDQAVRGTGKAEFLKQLAKAQALRDAAKAQRNMDITLAEASGNKALLGRQRFTEIHPETSGAAGSYFKKRPEQVKNAVQDELSNFGPSAIDPRLTGVAIQDAAKQSIDAGRKFASAQSTPSYTAVRGEGPIPALPELDNNPLFREIQSGILKDPNYGLVKGAPEQTQHALPDWAVYTDVLNNNPTKKLAPWSMESLVAIDKALGDKIYEASNPTAKANYSSLRSTLRSHMGVESPDYSIARGLYTKGAEAELDPRSQSIVGKVAATDNPVTQMGELIDKNLSRPQGVIQAAKDLKVRDPEAYRELIKTHIENQFNKALKPMAGTGDEYSGARFSRLMNDPQEKANLRALVRELPNGKGLWAGLNNLLETLKLTGNRFVEGSPTAANTIIDREMANTGVVRNAAQAVSSPLHLLWDFMKNRASRDSTRKWFNALYTDDGVKTLKKLAMESPGSQNAARLTLRFLSGPSARIMYGAGASNKALREGPLMDSEQ